MSGMSAPELRISYDGPVATSMASVTSGRYGGNARDTLNGVRSGVIAPDGAAPTSKVFRQRVR